MKRFIALWLIIIAASWYPAQAARTFSSNNYLTAALTPVTVAPMTVCAWFFSTSTTTAQTVVSFSNSAATGDRWSLEVRGDASQRMQWVARETVAGAATAFSAAAYSASTWTHICGVEAAGGVSRQMYVNGIADGSNSSTRQPSGVNQTYIGRKDAVNNEPIVGRLEHLVVYNAALTAPEVAQLANKAQPRRVRPTALISWVPVWGIHSPELDLVAPRSFTLTGTPPKADGAPVFWRITP